MRNNNSVFSSSKQILMVLASASDDVLSLGKNMSKTLETCVYKTFAGETFNESLGMLDTIANNHCVFSMAFIENPVNNGALCCFRDCMIIMPT